MHNDLQLFEYIFIDNRAIRTLFLLHGTGGSAKDLLFLNDRLEKRYNVVGLRGNIDEQGMRRFFRRTSFGVFDQENIREETDKLQRFIRAWGDTQQVILEQFFFLGYSNGATMLLATLFYYPDVLRNVVLLHPMLPFAIKRGSLDLPNQRVFVSVGVRDDLISPEQRSAVVATLESCKAQLTVREYEGGHELTDEELADVVAFLK